MSITFDTDKQRLDRDMVYRYLSGESYWARGLPRDIFERSLDGALCIGGYDERGQQVAFARVISDFATFAYLGDVFVLDMGEPVRIIDLAHRMVELSGRRVKTPEQPDGDIAIEITGLRPGEKLYEELLIGDDPQPTSHPRIMKAHEAWLEASELQAAFQRLDAAMEAGNLAGVREMLQLLVQGYRPETDIVDWLHLHKKKPPRGGL